MMQNLKKYLYGIFAAEISALSRYYDRIIQYHHLKHDTGLLFDAIECPEKIQLSEFDEFPDLSHQNTDRAIVLLNGTFNYCHDVQGLLKEIKPKLSRNSRVVAVVYNPYLKWLYLLTNLLGVRKGQAPYTFITNTDLNNICKISGYEIIRLRALGFCPFKWLFVGSLLNRVLPVIPLLRHFGLANVIVLRPIIPEKSTPSLSIIIPARNEKHNIENAIIRMPGFSGAKIEIVFVEGHSTDGTWEEILRVQKKYASQLNIQAFQQTGVGKSDAVNFGFSHANGNLLAILDADLTMPPEHLKQFYDIYCAGIADFINGSRLVYQMEKEAMRFLNRLGNIFFAKILSYILDTGLSDSLCGTKLLSRHDFHRILRWRNDFGNFDPFGDFELLFPAAVLAFGTINVPIRYMSRTYGDTNISRFRHGWMLFKMVLIGFFRIKLGKTG